MNWICILQAGAPVLLAVSMMSVNQQYIIKKVSLYKNTPKTRLGIVLLMKML